MRTAHHLAVTLAFLLLATSACASFEGRRPSGEPGPGLPPPRDDAAAAGRPRARAARRPLSPSGGSATLPDDLRTRPSVAAAIADTAERVEGRPGGRWSSRRGAR